MVASAGIINVARLGRVPIVPVTFAASRRRHMRSWDRMQAALPFTRGVFIWGEPIEVSSELDEAGVERARAHVEQRMRDMVATAEARVGHDACSLPIPAFSTETDLPAAELAGGKRR
jgi:lysophospholipid acyltransferase (LPLAT)-like uncharacterized protein